VKAWKGKAEEGASGFVDIFIQNIPIELEKHPKRPCFSRRGFSDWFKVNLIGGCRSLSAAIMEVETILHECFNRYACT
jgi:hypothetical protein